LPYSGQEEKEEEGVGAGGRRKGRILREGIRLNKRKLSEKKGRKEKEKRESAIVSSKLGRRRGESKGATATKSLARVGVLPRKEKG